MHRRVGHGFGPVRIRRELRERGVASELATRALAAYARGWDERAAQAREKRFGPAPPADRRQWLRQARFLEYRGFTAEHIRHALPEAG